MKIKKGVDYYPEFCNESDLENILQDVKLSIKKAPLFTPKMPKNGREFSVKISNLGSLGWVSDQSKGYHYQENHPITNKPWPVISDSILKIWHKLVNDKINPDCCLINYYNLNAKMGLHIDNDEKNFSFPVLSISIGAPALFRIGGLERKDKTQSIRLNHGDVIILKDESRLIYHGIDRIYKNSKYDYRINLTLRKVT